MAFHWPLALTVVRQLPVNIKIVLEAASDMYILAGFFPESNKGWTVDTGENLPIAVEKAIQTRNSDAVVGKYLMNSEVFK
jgi:hypothetical protein